MRFFKLFFLAALLLLAAASAASAGKPIYPDSSQARADITAALKSASIHHQRVILDFGGDWCGDCQVLDIYFHDPHNLPILEKNFVLVHVNVGHIDANLDLAEKYGIPLKKGVPALAVLDPDGKLVFSQKSGEFEAMRRMQSSEVTRFLLQWKPAGPVARR